MVDVRVEGPAVERGEEVLTPEALAFVADLQRRFGTRRDALLTARAVRHAELAAARSIEFRPETAEIRDGDWRVPPAPPGLVDRRVEIPGPTGPKTAINALSCGANVWLADREDATTPHWRNVEIDRLGDARRLFEQVALADGFLDFLTLPAYELID